MNCICPFCNTKGELQDFVIPIIKEDIVVRCPSKNCKMNDVKTALETNYEEQLIVIDKDEDI